MFRHPTNPPAGQEEKIEEKDREIVVPAAPKAEPKKECTNQELGELMEKNLKWSQIIYEQNRKINGKLLWYALAGWLRIVIIAALIGLSVWYIPPLIQSLISRYRALLGDVTDVAGKTNPSLSAVEQILKLLPLYAAQQEQIKATLK